MAEPAVPASSRRNLLAYAGAACAAALTGCSTYNANNGGIAGGQPAQASSTTAAGTATGTAAGTAPGSGAASPTGPAALASTSDVPVGGGTILTNQKIVITQPQAGKFEAFTAVCTHQGCIVNSVSGGTINCPCHGSKFSITNGSVVNGPAPSPLAPVSIKVQGTSILQA
jgi:Rieske Fe-S protein